MAHNAITVLPLAGRPCERSRPGHFAHGLDDMSRKLVWVDEIHGNAHIPPSAMLQ